MANFFEDFNSKKNKIKELAIRAYEYNWIDEARKQAIIDKLDHDTLTIGVIGQMKCGKSTFLNAFVFEDDVLPAATTPMTAALSVIKYGEQKRIVAEFYTENEWEEQKTQANRNINEITVDAEKEKVRAAQELVDKAKILGNNIFTLLGTTREDNFENLIQYVGADGKYVAITKSVTIYYPKEYLRGVEIVDTPGFNDPIVSREERTKDFLRRADVVLLLLYAGRAFDASDEQILFKHVRSCGIGKVLIGINKYDLAVKDGERLDRLISHVKEEIAKACKKCNDESLNNILEDVEPILFSAGMALLSELPMTIINSREEYKKQWDDNSNIFEIGNQLQFRECSKIDVLIDAIKGMIYNEKGKILFAKPVNAIMAAGQDVLTNIEKDLMECKSKIVLLSTPDEELEEKEENLHKAIRKMEKYIQSLNETIENDFTDISRKTRNELEDLLDATCRKLHNIVDDWGLLEDIHAILPKIEDECNKLTQRKIKNCLERQQKCATEQLKQSLNEFFNKVDVVLLRYLKDFDQRDFLNEAKQKINISVDNDIFSSNDKSDEESNNTTDDGITFGDVMDGLAQGIYAFLNGASFGILGKLNNVVSHNDIKYDLHTRINEMNSSFDLSLFVTALINKKDLIIENVTSKFKGELLEPMQKDFDEIRSNVVNKEQELEKQNELKILLEKKKEEICAQIEEIKSLN